MGIEMIWMRHGETTLNQNNIFCGRIDCELTAKAKQDAYAKRYPVGSFNQVYISPLKRTRQTANLVYPFLKPIVYQLLIEKSLGVWEGVKKSDLPLQLVEAMKEDRYLPAGAEPQEQVWNRILLFIQMISYTHQEGEKILVVCHNGCIKEIRRHILKDKIYQTANLETISIAVEKTVVTNATSYYYF